MYLEKVSFWYFRLGKGLWLWTKEFSQLYKIRKYFPIKILFSKKAKFNSKLHKEREAYTILLGCFLVAEQEPRILQFFVWLQLYPNKSMNTPLDSTVWWVNPSVGTCSRSGSAAKPAALTAWRMSAPRLGVESSKME